MVTALLALGVACAARAEPVALTFDDLPTLALHDSRTYATVTTKRLLHDLARDRLPATGFVIGDQLAGPRRQWGEDLLRMWLRAGFDLGNHTYSHDSLNKTAVATYIADVAHDDALIRPLMRRYGRHPRWFRHPFLDTGATLSDKQAFEAWLARKGYRVAPVTLENSDWMFSPVYDDALRRHDKVEAKRVLQSYIDYTAKVVPWYRKAALDLLGRRPALVFLLHGCRLNADALPALADILRRNDLRAASLDTVMADPAYRQRDDWADPDGDEWLTRWAHVLGRDLPWDDFPEPPADIAASSERLDPS